MTPEEQAAQAASIKAEATQELDENGNPVPKGESLISTLVKAGISGVATNMFVGVGVESVMGKTPTTSAAQAATQTKPLPQGQAPAVKGEIIKGPPEGGAFTDRPIMGGMAEQAANQPMNVDYGNQDKPDAVSAGKESGLMTVNGYDLNVVKYLPGADYVGSMAGDLEATDAASMLTQTILREGKKKDEDQELVNRVIGAKKAPVKGLSDEPAKKRGYLSKEILENVDEKGSRDKPGKVLNQTDKPHPIDNKQYMALLKQQEEEEREMWSIKRELR